METKLRKYRNNLVTAGWALILFCAWDVAKGVMSVFIETNYTPLFEDIFNMETVEEKVIAGVVFAVILGVILFLHIFVGKNAIAVGHGQKKGAAYIVIAILILAFLSFSVISTVINIIKDFRNLTMASLIIDITMIVAVLDLLISSFNVRYIIRKLEKGES